jgi:hypothetical protein|tara:strand:- start:154683 stop:155345 length:663 start_codon:yes stop_codon:yes gene_type:complete
MKSLVAILSLFFLSLSLNAQPTTPAGSDTMVKYRNIQGKAVLDAFIIDGDTIPIMVLDEVLFIETPTFDSREAKRRYYILKRKVFKVYPYVVVAGNKRDSLNIELAKISSKRKRRKKVKEFQRYIEDNFEEKLKKLTTTEGQILSKLLYRETGVTTYDLISTYRSGWRAFWWNTMANFYDISLKTPYDPENVEEDKLIENILLKAFAAGDLEERKKVEPF